MNDITMYRYAVSDPAHYNKELWTHEMMVYIQETCTDQLAQNKIRTIVPLDQIRNVMDSITEANPRVGTKETVQMIISYIVAYIVNEDRINKTPAYNSKVLKYDGQFGIQQFSQGQIGIKKRGLNQIGRMF